MKDANGQQTLESMSQAVWYNQWTLKKFEPYLAGEILEVGCGIGSFTQTLTKYGSVWAIDIDKGYIDKTKKLADGKAKVGFGDIEKGKYFFGKKEFDSIVCLNVLEHTQKDLQALENCHVLLKKSGYLILLIPSHPTLFGEIDYSIGHLRRYTKKEIENKLKNVGFKILRSRRLNFLGGIGWFMSGRIFKEAKVEERNIKVFNLFAPMVLPIEDLIEPPLGTSILIIAQK